MDPSLSAARHGGEQVSIYFSPTAHPNNFPLDMACSFNPSSSIQGLFLQRIEPQADTQKLLLFYN